jgi:hypothetical protein
LNRLIISSFLLLIACAALPGCRQDHSPTGIDALPGADLIGVRSFDTRKANATMTTSTSYHPISCATALYLSLGKTPEYESSTMLRWFALPTDVDSGGRIVSATVRMFVGPYHIGDSLSHFSFDVKEIKSFWSSYTFTADSLAALAVDPTPKGSYSGVAKDSIDFAIDTAMVRGWLHKMAVEDYAGIYGILLEPSASNSAVLSFESVDARTVGGAYNTRGPRLILVMNFGGADTTIIPSSTEDTYIARILQPITASLAVHAGLAWRGKVTFDVSGVPAGSIVNGVQLYLTKDPSKCRTHYRGIESVTVYEIVSATIDSLSSFYVTSRKGDTADVYVAEGSYLVSAVQRWVNNPGTNHGFKILKTGEITDLDYVEFYGAEAPPEKRPRLVITYTQRP